jgi:hypothetical protein
MTNRENAGALVSGEGEQLRGLTANLLREYDRSVSFSSVRSGCLWTA